METRPKLTKSLKGEVFLSYYYLKEELVIFCRENDIAISGNKQELTDRIFYFLNTGEKIKKVKIKRIKSLDRIIKLDSIIEENFVCSEIHREFFKEQIGKSFKFNVLFQKWLKENTGKTYKEAVEEYYIIIEKKKNSKTTIDKQFEYNSYIRDFFENNKGKTLEDAIKCWKYKKSLSGYNKYEKEDLIALK